MSDKKKAVIIGAGPAGLTAAHDLLSRAGDEWDVTVLEETQEVGGISRTVRHNGNRMDIGGHRFFSKERRVTDWWQERMPMQGAPSFDDRMLGRESPLAEGGPDPEREDLVEFPPVSLTGGNQAASGWLAYASSNSQGLM